ncbi:glycerol dehydrogenase [Halorubrum sp. N11]|uniref:glycerol dehydrogenase n=1 Tax=Halorubrum sp. N11 TaxID=3402276 RepID=UPI003EB89A85
MTRTFAAPSRYTQSAGALNQLGKLTERHGETAFVIADDTVWELTAETVTQSFESAAGTFKRLRFGGDCTVVEIDRLTTAAVEMGADVVVGIGGGKSLDTAKSVAARQELPVGSVPTIAATDSPTSSISIVYGEDGSVVDAEKHRRHPEFVLVDTAVIAQAPTRWFVSGIGDALATWYEATATWESNGTTVFEDRPTYAGRELAQACNRLLRDHARGAVQAVESDSVTEKVEAVTEAIILLSGLGFENGGLAAAHAIHDGLTTLPGAESATHGEKVTIGLLTQLLLEGATDEDVGDIRNFAVSVGLPTDLSGLGVTDPSDEELEAVGRVATDPTGPIGNEPVDVSVEQVADALRVIENFDSIQQ